jgi:SAM-dependent methyltransferase
VRASSLFEPLQVSVDYLINPLEVFREVKRVLRPNGRFLLSQSNRLFFSKAIAKWIGLGDFGRLELIGDYFHYAGGFSQPSAFDITATGNRKYKDPMYIVEATKI